MKSDVKSVADNDLKPGELTPPPAPKRGKVSSITLRHPRGGRITTESELVNFVPDFPDADCGKVSEGASSSSRPTQMDTDAPEKITIGSDNDTSNDDNTPVADAKMNSDTETRMGQVRQDAKEPDPWQDGRRPDPWHHAAMPDPPAPPQVQAQSPAEQVQAQSPAEQVTREQDSRMGSQNVIGSASAVPSASPAPTWPPSATPTPFMPPAPVMAPTPQPAAAQGASQGLDFTALGNTISTALVSSLGQVVPALVQSSQRAANEEAAMQFRALAHEMEANQSRHNTLLLDNMRESNKQLKECIIAAAVKTKTSERRAAADADASSVSSAEPVETRQNIRLTCGGFTRPGEDVLVSEGDCLDGARSMLRTLSPEMQALVKDIYGTSKFCRVIKIELTDEVGTDKKGTNTMWSFIKAVKATNWIFARSQCPLWCGPPKTPQQIERQARLRCFWLSIMKLEQAQDMPPPDTECILCYKSSSVFYRHCKVYTVDKAGGERFNWRKLLSLNPCMQQEVILTELAAIVAEQKERF